MTRDIRIQLGLSLVAMVALSTGLHAQQFAGPGMMPAGGPAGMPAPLVPTAWSPNGMPPGMPAGTPPGMPAAMPPGMPSGPMMPPGVPPAAMMAPAYAPPPMMHGGMGGGYPHGMPAQMACPPVRCDPGVINYRLRQHPSYCDERQPIEAFLTQFVRRSWIRLEYMMWNVEEPGRFVLGAPVAGTDTTEPFEVFNATTGQSEGFAIAPSLENISLNDVIGIRGTYGMWFNGGALEWSFYGLEQADDTLIFPDIAGNRPPPPDPTDPNPPLPDAGIGTVDDPNIVLPLLLNGSPSDPTALGVILFDDSYRATIKNQMWGSELNVFTKPHMAEHGFSWQWMGGLRYLSFDEELTQVGVFNDGGNQAPVTSVIKSSTTNNVYGPQAGFRAQMASQYLTLSVTPRIMLGVNDYTARLSTSGLGNIPPRASDESVDFSAVTQISFLAELQCTPKFSFFGGYDLMWASAVTRAYNNIYYNSIRPPIGSVAPQLSQRVQRQTLGIDGWSFGGVIRF